jgi:DNA-binding response OmpR family regulator
VTPYILVVEDEDALATLLHYNLEKEGYLQVGNNLQLKGRRMNLDLL